MAKGLPTYEEVVESALDVFKQYDTALTLRQLYYRLVSRHLFPNTINSYKRLSRLMVRAREEGAVPVNCLEDRSRRVLGRGDAGYTSAQDFLKRRLASLRESYKEFRMPMWDVQPNYIVVSLEKDALSRLVGDIANQYAVRTFPTRGYPSFTYVQRMAGYIRNRLKGKPTVVLYFGDFDPFGDFDLIFGAAKMALKIVDVPIRYRERLYGDIKISRFRHGWLLLKMCAFGWRKLKMPSAR